LFPMRFDVAKLRFCAHVWVGKGEPCPLV
jgi:hypothetical protein